MNTSKHLAIFIFLTAIIFFGAAVKSINAATFTVIKNGDTHDANQGNGICADSAGACTLRAAVEESNALSGDDTILFNTSLTGQTIVLDMALNTIEIKSNVTVNGLGANFLAVSGDGKIGVFAVTGGATIMRDLTIRDGDNTSSSGSGLGGGINISNSSMTLENVIVTGNKSLFGGGVNAEYAAITMTSVTLSNNHADLGSSSVGGGMATFRSDITMTDCTVAGNTTRNLGGGVYFEFGMHRISGTTFSGNSAGSIGGGLEVDGGELTMVNSTVSGNTALTGGGIASGGTVTLRNVTIAGNTATNSGGGFSTVNGGKRIANTIVADNTAPASPDIDGVFTSLGNNLVRNRAGSSGYIASDLPDGTNPLLGALANNGGATETRALMAGSPAVNAGNNAQALDTDNTTPLASDQRAGFPRIVSGTVDIGAFESKLAPTAASVSVGGRVMTAAGRGISRVYVSMTGSDGETRTAMTNPFGYFRFDAVAAGETYVFTIRSKQLRPAAVSAAQVRAIFEDADDIDFVVEPLQRKP